MINRFLALLLLVLLLPLTASAQRGAQLRDVRTSYDKNISMESVEMIIDASVDEVSDRWEDFWDDRYDVDVDKLDKDKQSISFLGEQVSLPLVSSKNFDLYSKIGGTDEQVRVAMSVAYSANDVVSRDSHRESYEAVGAIMNEFRTYFYSTYFDEKLEEAREDLDDIRDDSADASKDAEKARKKIEKYEKKIEKYREKIEETREEVGDELETAEEKAARAKELEERVRELERMRAKYLG